MRVDDEKENEASVWGTYPNYDDMARLEYGRRLWRIPEARERLLRHWLDSRHPYRRRFLERRAALEELLGSDLSEAELDRLSRSRGTTLRCLAREIPPVFGSFY